MDKRNTVNYQETNWEMNTGLIFQTIKYNMSHIDEFQGFQWNLG